MSDKQGTALGRAITNLIPVSSPFHAVAENVDETFEHLIFDDGIGADVPLSASTDVTNTIFTLKPFFLQAIEMGIISIDWPGVDGDDETKVEQGLKLILEGYVNQPQ